LVSALGLEPRTP